MCGILGAIDPGLDARTFEEAVRMQKHRGPDNLKILEESYQGTKTYLGHNRLSIIDLSEAANQPFRSASGRYLLTFNGEIYNYKELKKELSSTYQKQFRTTGDTELVVEAFDVWGIECLSKFNGMFAFSIYDCETGTHTLARDRLGIKPLYILNSGSRFIYGSELKSVKHIAGKLPLNDNAISLFLHLGYIPEPYSIYEEITKFPAGAYGRYENGNLKIESYWKPEDHRVETENVIDDLDRLINDSVKARLIADVPIGSFLSGGIDSSLISAIASKHTSGPLNTFNIGFTESRFDESKYAREVAKQIGSNHTEVVLSESDALEKVEMLQGIYDEPFADSSALPTLMVSEIASKDVKVCLSGDGGDELFMGYGMYNWAKRLNKPWIRALKPLIGNILSSSSNPRNKRAAWLFHSDSGNQRSHIFSQEQYLFSRRDMNGFMKKNSLPANFPDVGGEGLSPAERQALFDIQFYLKDDLLVKVDRASMHHSLEVRVPLLDHRVVEFALSLNEEYRNNKGVSKVALKEVLYRYVPKEVFDRPKQGFSVPLASWLKKELKYLPDRFLTDEVIGEVGYFHVSEITGLKESFEGGNDLVYNKIWALSTLHKWIVEQD